MSKPSLDSGGIESPIDPDAQWERTERVWESAVAAGRGAGGYRVELYTRASRRLRVRLPGSGVPLVEYGVDSGLAVRLHDPDEAVLGFAAGAGIAPEVAACATRMAAARLVPCDHAPWSESQGDRFDVRDGPHRLPDPENLARWLCTAVPDAEGGLADEPWVEASVTVETLRNDTCGWLRGRRRVWAACLSPVVSLRGAEPVARVVAAEDPGALPPDPWSTVSFPVFEPTGPHGASSSEGVIFDGDALATLVPALARSLYAGGAANGVETGPGWIVADDPSHPLSLVGGSWDDAGFPSRRRLLADGCRSVGWLEGPGCLLRGSFRDPPESAVSLLTVHPPAVSPPRKAHLVRAARIHPLYPAWIIETDGVLLREGTPCGEFSGHCIATNPRSLVRSCVGGIGEPGLRAGVVLSPALCFEGVRVEA